MNMSPSKLNDEQLQRIAGGLIMQKKNLKVQWKKIKASDKVTGKKLEEYKEGINSELQGLNETLEVIERHMKPEDVQEVKEVTKEAIEQGGMQFVER